MLNGRRNERTFLIQSALVIALAIIGTAVMSVHSLAMTAEASKAKRPADAEFGLGPRASADGRYLATLEPAEALRTRKTQTLCVRLTDAAGQDVDDAQLTIDGGMPEHGHGLPTRPRVSRLLGNGRYEIEGVRFSMGGWWEFKVIVTVPGGGATITFNLAL